MSWMMAAGTAISIGGSMLKGRSAKKAAQARDAANQQYALGYARSGQEYGNSMLKWMPQAQDAYTYRPATVNNGFGTSSIDPNTGQMSYSLNGPYAGLRDNYLSTGNSLFGQGSKLFQQANSFDPQSMAKDRYEAALKVMAPSDEASNQSLMQDLYNKGGFGVSNNVAAAGGGVTAANPYVSTFLNARNQRNNDLSYKSLGEGENYLSQLYSRANGMFSQGNSMVGQGINLDKLGYGSLGDAMTYGGMLNTARRSMFDKLYGIDNSANQAYLNANNKYYDVLSGGNSDPGRGADGRGAMYGGAIQQIGGAMGGGFGGMLGGRGFGGLGGDGFGFGGIGQLNPGGGENIGGGWGFTG